MINKIYEINGINVYFDKYIQDDQVLRGRKEGKIEYYIVGKKIYDALLRTRRNKTIEEILNG